MQYLAKQKHDATARKARRSRNTQAINHSHEDEEAGRWSLWCVRILPLGLLRLLNGCLGVCFALRSLSAHNKSRCRNKASEMRRSYETSIRSRAQNRNYTTFEEASLNKKAPRELDFNKQGYTSRKHVVRGQMSGRTQPTHTSCL